MTAELGTFFLIVALMASLFQAAYALPRGNVKSLLAPCLMPASFVQCACIVLAFAALMLARIDSDFSVVNVAAHSNISLPLLYKIAGTWGNHEGSMLLWVLVLAVFGALLAGSRYDDDALIRTGVSMQALVCAGVLAFILYTSSPFVRQFPPPADGQALNPLLQDIALSVHPPLLYVGYVGFSIVYSLAVAALICGRISRDWAALIHPWILASWSSLTLGIGLGSWWAYRELGWGGWWFWDPVENASLLPWLSGTALLHANIVYKKRGMLAQWVLLLAIITFGLSLLGTFLVRSGALTSVHSFASDPARGMFILMYMTAVIGGGLFLFALRADKARSVGGMLPFSREGMIVINNMFVLSACATVLIGTTYPLLAEWLSGSKLTVGPPYFNITFLPLMAVPLFFAGMTPFMPWKEASFARVMRHLAPAAMAGFAAAALVLAVAKTHILFAAVGFALAAWLAYASVQWLWRGGLRRQAMPVFLGHLGVAVMVAGITGVGLWKEEREQWLRPGESLSIGGYEVTYDKAVSGRGVNYEVTRTALDIRSEGAFVTTLFPEYRRYDIVKSETNEAAIYSSWAGNLYAVTGAENTDASPATVPVRLYYIPMIDFIWAGFMLMAIAGVMAMPRMKGNTREQPAI